MKSYFNFSRGQRIGVIVFACIILLQIIYLNKGSGISIPDPFVISPEQYKIIDSANYQKKYAKDVRIKAKYKLSNFDPNEYSNSDWEKIGFSTKQARIIVNYKIKINGFKTNADVEKIFVINEEKFGEISPFLKIKESGLKEDVTNKYSEYSQPLLIYELNSASLEELISIKGIGDFTAAGIIKHKKSIGGFHSITQLKEVYGIDDDNLIIASKQLVIDDSGITTFNVNELSIFELKKHHYLTWNISEAIINKRLTGKLTSLDFLVSDSIVTQERLNSISPYVRY